MSIFKTVLIRDYTKVPTESEIMKRREVIIKEHKFADIKTEIFGHWYSPTAINILDQASKVDSFVKVNSKNIGSSQIQVNVKQPVGDDLTHLLSRVFDESVMDMIKGVLLTVTENDSTYLSNLYYAIRHISVKDIKESVVGESVNMKVSASEFFGSVGFFINDHGVIPPSELMNTYQDSYRKQQSLLSGLDSFVQTFTEPDCVMGVTVISFLKYLIDIVYDLRIDSVSGYIFAIKQIIKNSK